MPDRHVGPEIAARPRRTVGVLRARTATTSGDKKPNNNKKHVDSKSSGNIDKPAAQLNPPLILTPPLFDEPLEVADSSNSKKS